MSTANEQKIHADTITVAKQEGKPTNTARKLLLFCIVILILVGFGVWIFHFPPQFLLDFLNEPKADDGTETEYGIMSASTEVGERDKSSALKEANKAATAAKANQVHKEQEVIRTAKEAKKAETISKNENAKAENAVETARIAQLELEVKSHEALHEAETNRLKSEVARPVQTNKATEAAKAVQKARKAEESAGLHTSSASKAAKTAQESKKLSEQAVQNAAKAADAVTTTKAIVLAEVTKAVEAKEDAKIRNTQMKKHNDTIFKQIASEYEKLKINKQLRSLDINGKAQEAVESTENLPTFGKLMYSQVSVPQYTVPLLIENNVRMHIQIEKEGFLFVASPKANMKEAPKLENTDKSSKHFTSYTLPPEWNPSTKISSQTAGEVRDMYIETGIVNPYNAHLRVMSEFNVVFPPITVKSKTGFHGDKVDIVAKQVPKSQIIVEIFNGIVKIMIKRNTKWLISTFNNTLEDEYVYCILPPSTINACFRSSPQDCSVADACAIMDCESCIYQSCVASSDNVLLGWIEGGAIGFLEANAKKLTVQTELLGIKKHKPMSKIYGYGPDALLNVITMSHFNITAHTSTQHVDLTKRLMNVFLGNSMSVYFNEGGFVSIEFPQDVRVNCAAIATQLEDTAKQPLFSLFAYDENNSKMLLSIGNVRQSKEFTKFEFKEVKAKKFELLVTESKTGMTYARLGLVETFNVFTAYEKCPGCGGVTKRNVNGEFQEHTCPVRCKWLPQPWGACNSECTQFRTIACGAGSFTADDLNECEGEPPPNKQECFTGDCVVAPGSPEYFEKIIVEDTVIKYRMKYQNSHVSWDWQGGQKARGEFHGLIMALKLDFLREVIFQIGDIRCIIDQKNVEIVMGSSATINYNPRNAGDAAGQYLFLAMEAADPPQDLYSTVSVGFRGKWYNKKGGSAWFPGDRTITISPYVYRMFWYASPVRIPRRQLERMTMFM